MCEVSTKSIIQDAVPCTCAIITVQGRPFALENPHVALEECRGAVLLNKDERRVMHAVERDFRRSLPLERVHSQFASRNTNEQDKREESKHVKGVDRRSAGSAVGASGVMDCRTSMRS
jgi:hypothetical protein